MFVYTKFYGEIRSKSINELLEGQEDPSDFNVENIYP